MGSCPSIYLFSFFFRLRIFRNKIEETLVLLKLDILPPPDAGCGWNKIAETLVLLKLNILPPSRRGLWVEGRWFRVEG